MLSQTVAVAALLATAAGLIWLRRRQRVVVDDPAALELRHRLPVLALLPAAPGAEFTRRREGAPPPPDGPGAEALRGLWLRLRLELQERGARLVLVTGPAPESGAESGPESGAVALGLAMTAAREGGPVLLAGPAPGWPENTPEPGLRLLPAGAGEVPDPAALAGAAEAEGAVVVLFCPDPRPLAALPPAAGVMVARQGATRVTALRALRRALARRGLRGAGTVVTGYRTRRARQFRG